MNDLTPFEPILDALHEAAFIPEGWPQVLDKLAAIIDSDKAAFIAVSGSQFRGLIGNAAIQSAAKVFVSEGWADRNRQAERMLRLGEPRFIRDHDVFSDEEMATDPYYTDFLEPQGMRWGAATYINSPGEDTMVLTLHRASEFGPIDRADTDRLTMLRPHIARAALTATRLRLQQSQVALDILEKMGFPAAALDPSGHLKMANAKLQLLIPTLLEDRRDRLISRC